MGVNNLSVPLSASVQMRKWYLYGLFKAMLATKTHAMEAIYYST